MLVTVNGVVMLVKRSHEIMNDSIILQDLLGWKIRVPLAEYKFIQTVPMSILNELLAIIAESKEDENGQ